MEPDAKLGPPGSPDRHDEAADLDRALDEALEETFPASDAVNLTQPRGKSPQMRGPKARPK